LLIKYLKNKKMSKINLDNLPKSIIIPNSIEMHSKILNNNQKINKNQNLLITYPEINHPM
jgi:hypothetical protein